MAIQKEEVIVKISELTSPDFNVRNHPQKQIEELIRSIKKFGQIRPLVIDENNVIYSGNGLYEAMKQMGAETIEAYRVTGLSDKDKKKLMLADNKVFSLGTDNFVNIEAMIKDLGDFEIPGFDEEVLQNLYGEAEELAESFNYGSLSAETVEKMKSGVETQARLEKKYEEQAAAQPAPATSYTPPAQPQTAEALPERQEVNRFIICPHCGEKIYI